MKCEFSGCGGIWDHAREDPPFDLSVSKGVHHQPSKWQLHFDEIGSYVRSMPPRRRKVVMSRLLKPGEKDDGSFDHEFWKRAGTNAVLDAMWQMVNDYRKIRGLEGDEPPMRRDIVRIIRPQGK